MPRLTCTRSAGLARPPSLLLVQPPPSPWRNRNPAQIADRSRGGDEAVISHTTVGSHNCSGGWRGVEGCLFRFYEDIQRGNGEPLQTPPQVRRLYRVGRLM